MVENSRLIENLKVSLKPLLVAGVGPLPPEEPERLFAPGLRIWGIARELFRAGHPIRLATVRFSGSPLDRLYIHDLLPAADSSSPEIGVPRVCELTAESVSESLLKEALNFKAAALVGSTDLINRELGSMNSDLPLWLDYFGDPMAERQMLAYLHNRDDGLADQWRTLVPALLRGDRFSGCSRQQVGAIHGEIASLGRLNRWTSGEPLVQLLPPWIEPIEPTREPGPFLRGVRVPDDAFIVIQTGGFNTWLDIETLFAALEIAMRNHPKLHFAATGGAIPGHNIWSFGKFEKLIAESEHRDRYHLLGWLPLGQVPRVIEESNLGLNVDLPCPEGWLGTRNRLMDWMLSGLPVVSTMGSELAQDLAEKDLIFAPPQRDPGAIAEAIGRVAADPDESKGRVAAAQHYLREMYAPARSLRPLLEWAAKPGRAPDLIEWKKNPSLAPELWLQGRTDSQRMAEIDETKARLARAEERLKTMEGSALVRAALWVRRHLGRGQR